MRIAAIVCLFLTGCITDPVSKVQWDLTRDYMGRHSHFVELTEWEPLREIDGVTYGDCSNFAISAHNALSEIGVDSRIAIGERITNAGPILHAFVLTNDGRVLDNHMALPSQIQYYKNRLVNQQFSFLKDKDLRQ